MRMLVLGMLLLALPTPAFAVDWSQDTEKVFEELRANKAWTCELGTNIIDGKENALECKIEDFNGRGDNYFIELAASPAVSGKWIESVTISVSPLEVLPDPKINRQYLAMADFPYRGALLRDRYKTIDDMLAACRLLGKQDERTCSLRESNEAFEYLSINTGTYPSQTFFFVTVSIGRTGRCLQDEECAKRFKK